MPPSDPVATELMEIIAALQSGEKVLARERFGALWVEIEGRAPLHECVLCHYMADAQDDPAEELRWDRRALETAQRAEVDHDAGVAVPADSPFGGLSLASFFPSLHLNLAADHEVLGDLERARAHLLDARRSIEGLPDTDMARSTARAIERLGERLGVGVDRRK